MFANLAKLRVLYLVAIGLLIATLMGAVKSSHTTTNSVSKHAEFDTDSDGDGIPDINEPNESSIDLNRYISELVWPDVRLDWVRYEALEQRSKGKTAIKSHRESMRRTKTARRMSKSLANISGSLMATTGKGPILGFGAKAEHSETFATIWQTENIVEDGSVATEYVKTELGPNAAQITIVLTVTNRNKMHTISPENFSFELFRQSGSNRRQLIGDVTPVEPRRHIRAGSTQRVLFELRNLPTNEYESLIDSNDELVVIVRPMEFSLPELNVSSITQAGSISRMCFPLHINLTDELHTYHVARKMSQSPMTLKKALMMLDAQCQIEDEVHSFLGKVSGRGGQWNKQVLLDKHGLIEEATLVWVEDLESIPLPSPITYSDYELYIEIPADGEGGIFRGRYLLDGRFHFSRFFKKSYRECLSSVRSLKSVETGILNIMFAKGSPCTDKGTLPSYQVPTRWMANAPITIPPGWRLRIDTLKAFNEREERIIDFADDRFSFVFETVSELPPTLPDQLTNKSIELREEWIRSEKAINRIPFTSLELYETNMIEGGDRGKHLLIVVASKEKLSVAEPIRIIFSGELLPPQTESNK